MNRLSFALTATLLFLLVGLSSCEAIGDIFQAGIWVGVIGVGLVVFLILYFIRRAKKIRLNDINIKGAVSAPFCFR
ncbi:MAG: hypothetical protein WKF88_03100 [Ferruginibacter sp.]